MSQRSPARAANLRQLQQTKSVANSYDSGRNIGVKYANSSEIIRAFDCPITASSSYNYATLQATLSSHGTGSFGDSGRLSDLIIGDDMVSGSLESRYVMLASLFQDKKAIEIEPSPIDYGGKCAGWWSERLATIVDSSVLEFTIRDSIMMGFSVSQIVWNGWEPSLERWHPALTYYNQSQKNFVALTMNAGTEPILPGGGKWVLYSPFDHYQSWVHGGVRKLGPVWLIKQFCMRDWSRYSTVYGNLIKVLKHPSKLDTKEKLAVVNSISELQSEGVVVLPQGNGQGRSFDLEILAPPTGSSDVFSSLLDACDKKITTYLLGQDATTNLKGGSYNAVGVAFAGLTLGKARRDLLSINDRFLPQLVKSVSRVLWGSEDFAPKIRIKPDAINYTIGDNGGPEESNDPVEPTGGPQKQGKEAPAFGRASDTLPGKQQMPQMRPVNG